KRKRKELEGNLLDKLSSTKGVNKGSLVDDDSMISILSTTKHTAAEVGVKLSAAAEAEVKINIAQAEYRPVASRGSTLYFLITEMSMVNVMYQTSLGQFLKIFDLSLAQKSEKSSKTQKWIANIIEYLTYEVFRYTVRGLYENHKFIFTLLLALKIDLQNKKIEHDHFQILIKGKTIITAGKILTNCISVRVAISFYTFPTTRKFLRYLLKSCVHYTCTFSEQSSIKFTNDPPQGVRAGLKRTFAGISQNQLEVSNLPMWKPILYSVAFLHTGVQSEYKFGSLGWNIPYEFNSADFTASVEFVERHLDDCGPRKWVTWVTVRNMLAEVQYGGRVTDDYDKRLLKCFAREWFSKMMSDPSFCFYTGYNPCTVDEYMECIQSLPTIDSPEALGLHSNADITYKTNTSAGVLDTITNIQPKDIFTKCKVQKSFLILILKLLSINLRDALDNIFDARVPKLWRKISWESSTLGFWFTELLERNKQFIGRPKTFWTTGFFNPQGEFLTAMRQEVTRANKGWALDTVTLTNKVLKHAQEEITASPTEGVYVYGLYLEGAGWDKKNTHLIESSAKVLFTALQVIHMFAINSTAPVDPKLCVCPIYKTDLNYITAVVLPTMKSHSPDHWIMCGVALLCDIK
uniref:Dynein heavy chain 8, axonemal n=1 Tax=Gasterosteus aculeatus TaxID=69293 RepID=G3Q6H1_GASAC